MNEAEVPSLPNSLSAAERQKLLVDWNATETELPNAGCIHELIEQRAREMPDATALICRDKQLTYCELNARAERVAAHLRELGVESQRLVGICVERSLDMVIGLLGILKSGGAYVPLDPTYPKERLAFMIEDSKPLVLLTESARVDQLPKTHTHIVCLDTIESAADVREPEPSNHATRNTHLSSVALLAKEDHGSPLAYVIYTSGSTGKPKGVMVEHGNVLNFFAAMDACIPCGRGDSWLAVTSPSFDISVLELFWTLSRGLKVVIYSGDNVTQAENPADYSIPTLIQLHRVTHLQCTPSMGSMLLLDERTRISLGQLQTLLIGGEPFPVNLARQLREIFKGTILNMYGPTETTVWSTTWQLPADAVPARIPVGRPIANTQIYIVDSSLQPVPVGAEGELLIGGAGVARGYLGRDQLTAERFIPNPFAVKSPSVRAASRPGSQQPQTEAAAEHSSTRLYRTGDRARYLPDGNIELLGRIDHQFKIRGHRVEPGEIEALLNEHPTVRENVVLLRELGDKGNTLVAYVIARDGEKPTREKLREYAKEKLPDYMVPSHVIFMSAFPQTPNKKIDRHAFPVLESDMPQDNDDSEQPATPVEEALAALWRELLGLQRVRRGDNFFESGGHSLLAMQLVAKVRKRFNIDFPLKNVFERQTLAGMAEIIEAMSWSDFAKASRAGEREVVDV